MSELATNRQPSEPPRATSTNDRVVADARKPLTTKDRVVGGAMALALIALCVGIWVKPDLFAFVDASEMSGRGGRKVANILAIIWSRPVGTIAGLLGVLVLLGAVLRRGGAATDSLAAPS